MKKVIVKRAAMKPMLASALMLGGTYYLFLINTNSSAVSFACTSVIALFGIVGLLAMKIYGKY